MKVQHIRFFCLITAIFGVSCLGGNAHGQCLVNELDKVFSDSAAAGGQFGKSVSIDGGRVVIGAPNEGASGPFFMDGEGAVYVVERVGGSWTPVEELLIDDVVFANGFGAAVDVSGDWIIAGAPFDSDSGSQAGAAYMFRREAGGWQFVTKLLASDGVRNDWFGSSVAIDGQVAVVGAPQNTLTGPGFAYVFRLVQGQWVEEAKLVASDAGSDDAFGISVDVAGSIIAVGAWNRGNTGQSFPDGDGAVYMFHFDGTDWVERNRIEPVGTPADQRDRFGRGVSLNEDGSILAVITDAITFAPPGPTGSIQVFRDNGKDWAFEARLVPANSDAIARSVAISGETIVGGAWRHWSVDQACPPSDECTSGSAFVFRRDSKSGWIEQGRLDASDIERGDNFGWAVALDGDHAVIGSWRDGDHGIDSGSAYVFGGMGDCNGNGVLDACDLADGTSEDLNHNGRPDSCDCGADFNADGVADFFDVQSFLNAFAGQDPRADLNGDGAFDFFDVQAFLNQFAAGCP